MENATQVVNGHVVPDYSNADSRDYLTEVHRYHAPKNDQLPRYDEIRRETLRLSHAIDRCCPDGNLKELAQAMLTQAKMFANAAIAVGEASRAPQVAPPAEQVHPQ